MIATVERADERKGGRGWGRSLDARSASLEQEGEIYFGWERKGKKAKSWIQALAGGLGWVRVEHEMG